MRLALAMVVAVSSLSCVRAARPTAEVSAELMQLERGWSAAFLKHDRATVERLIADDYVGTDGRGFMSNKADELKEVDAPPPAGPQARVVLDESISDLTVRAFGDVAVVNGIANEKIRWQGEETTVRYRRTTVWVVRDGRWQCVSFHGSRIIDPT